MATDLLIQCGDSILLADVQYVKKLAKLFHMNGGLLKMVDHFEMRQAMLRALDTNKTDFTDVCNICKIPNFDKNTNTLNISSNGKNYHIWHCEYCSEEEKEAILA